MNFGLEQFLIRLTPASRVLLAVFAVTPFLVFTIFCNWLALHEPEFQVGVNRGPLLLLQAIISASLCINLGVAASLWPRRQEEREVPVATLTVCLSIGLLYTIIAIFEGLFTQETNLILLGILAIGLLLFEVKPMWLTFKLCVVTLVVAVYGCAQGWWPYAPVFTDQVMQGREPVWWFHWWRQYIFWAGYLAILPLLLFLFDRLDAVMSALRKLSYTDALTGLSNRRSFMEGLSDETARQGITGKPLSILLIDADHFKKVNDLHGHAVGDEVLSGLGTILLSCIRTPTDLACRLGGEEFALILPDTARPQAEVVAERLRQLLSEKTFGPPSSRFQLTVSIGLVESRVQTDASSILQSADQALYRAKSAGRNRVCWAELGSQPS